MGTTARCSPGGDPALVYNSATVNVRPTINLSIQGDANAAAAAQAEIDWTWNGVAQTPVFVDLSSLPAGSIYNLAVQPDNPVTMTGSYNWSALITLTLADNSTEWAKASGSAVVAAGDGNAIGAGWSLAGIPQLMVQSGSVLWQDGQGDIFAFVRSANGTFTTPAGMFGTLVQNSNGTYTYTNPDQSQDLFNSQGLLTAVRQPLALGSSYLTLRSYSYDTRDRLIQVTADDNGVTTLSYDGGTGLLDQISEPGGRIVSLTHDDNGDLTQITDAAGYVRTFSYNSSHDLTEDQWSPLDATFSYDATTGLLTGMDRGLGDTYSIVSAAAVALGATPAGPTPTPSTAGTWASITNALGETTQYLLDPQAHLLQQVLPSGDTYSYQYNTAGLVTQSTDPMGYMHNIDV